MKPFVFDLERCEKVVENLQKENVEVCDIKEADEIYLQLVELAKKDKLAEDFLNIKNKLAEIVVPELLEFAKKNNLTWNYDEKCMIKGRENEFVFRFNDVALDRGDGSTSTFAEIGKDIIEVRKAYLKRIKGKILVVDKHEATERKILGPGFFVLKHFNPKL